MLLGVTRPAGTRAGGITIARGEEAVARSLGWIEAEDAVRERRGTPVRATPTRTTFRMQVPAQRGETTIVYRKVHAPSRLPWRFRRSAARVEWERLHELAALGFRVPAPVLLAESGAGSVLVTHEVTGALPLDQWLATHLPGPGDPAAHVPVARIVAAVAGLVARLHAAGFFHRDLYLCHLFLRTPAEEPTLIDLQRVRHGRRPRERWFVKDLAALASSTPPGVGAGRRLRFLRTYLERRGLAREWKAWARKVLAKARRIAAHVPKHG
jgi:hypothetical protein